MTGSAPIITPPVTHNYTTLPYHELSWEHFERMTYSILCAEHGVENVSAYGERGQKQFGFDFYVRPGTEEKFELYQCKQVVSFDATALKKMVHHWEQGKWFGKTTTFTLVCSGNLISAGFIEEFEREHSRFKKVGIKLCKLGAPELDTKLKLLPAIVDEFFGELWRDKFCSSYALRNFLAGNFPLLNIPRKSYAAVAHYIERKLKNPNKQEEVFSNYFSDQHISLYNYVEESFQNSRPARVLIRAAAAAGKSKELEQLAYRYSDPKKGIYPVLIRLVNFKSGLEAYITHFYPQWQEVPAARLILLFDGLDEVTALHFTDFIKEFNLFVEGHPDISIVAAIRTNVYSSSIGNGITAKNRLLLMYLDELDYWAWLDYANKRIVDLRLRETFGRYVQKNWVKEVLHSPFFLCGLIDLFLNDSANLPQHKAELIQKLLTNKIKQDSEKYQEQLPVTQLLEFAEKLALYLTLTGKNAVSDKQLYHFTDLAMATIARSGLFKTLVDESGTYILFDHNNFQEYLAAKQLAGVPWSRLQSILFHLDGEIALKPKMLNTVNFLFTLLSKDSNEFILLFETIHNSNAALLLQFEKDKLSVDLRLSVFKQIILKGKSEGIYYFNGDYHINDLGDFVAYSAAGFSFLLEELSDTRANNHLLCVLDFIHYYRQQKINTALRTALLSKLRELILQPGFDEAVYDRCIDILADYRFFETELLDSVIKRCPLIDNKTVRKAMINYVIAAGRADALPYILESSEILINGPGRTYSHDPSWVYLEAIEKFLNGENALLVVNYFAHHKKSVQKFVHSRTFTRKSGPLDEIYVKLGEIYAQRQSPDLYEAYVQFLVALNFQPHKAKDWGDPMLFFRSSNIKEVHFKEFLLHTDAQKLEYFLPSLFSVDLFPWVVENYKKALLTKQHIYRLRSVLSYSNRDMHNLFQHYLLTNLGREFAYQPTVDWDKIHAEREQNNFKVLADRGLFLKEAKKLYQLVAQIRAGHDQSDEDLIFELEFDEKRFVRNKLNNTLIYNLIQAYEIEGGYPAFKNFFKKNQWEDLVFTQVEQCLGNGKKESIPTELIQAAVAYLTRVILPRVDYINGITDQGDQCYQISWDVLSVTKFYSEGLLQLTQEEQLQLLKLDYMSYFDIHDPVEDKQIRLYRLIYQENNPHSFKAAVLNNLSNSALTPRVRVSQAHICNTYGYEEGIYEIMEMLEDKHFSADLKRYLVDILIDLAPEPDLFDNMIRQWTGISEEWQLKIGQFLKRFVVYREWLIQIIETSDLGAVRVRQEIYWKYELIRLGIEIGSKKIIAEQFEIFTQNKSKSDHLHLQSSHFQQLIATDPLWFMERCLSVLKALAPLLKEPRHNELPELLEELIRLCGSSHKDLFKLALAGYENIIQTYQVEFPDVSHLKWYERRLIKAYYAQAASYETDAEAWEIINELRNH